jgi:hypothetical protein
VAAGSLAFLIAALRHDTGNCVYAGLLIAGALPVSYLARRIESS